MTSLTDSVVRALTTDGAFRVIVASTTSTTRGAVDAQAARGATARHFADLVTGSILVRETMAPTLRVQGIVKGAGKTGGLVGDSHPDGSARGLVQVASGVEIDLDGALLQMMRTLPNGALHQGIVELGGDLSQGLMIYMQQSEQVESVIAVGTLFEGDRVVDAGGYIVQLLPEASPGALALMTERLTKLPPLAELLGGARSEPRALLAELLTDQAYEVLEESPLRFECRCSHERVLASLGTLPRHEIKEMRDERRTFEITCDYCQVDYKITTEDLEGILDVN